MNVSDVLLYGVSTKEGTDRFIRYLGQAIRSLPSEANQAPERIAFRLLPSEIQDRLSEGNSIRISGDSQEGGRFLRQIREGADDAELLVIPLLRRRKKLSGFLIIVSDSELEIQSDPVNACPFTEVVQLNGLILLANIRRQKRLGKRQRELSQWRRIADHACDVALQINEHLGIVRVIPFGSGSNLAPVAGLRLTDIVDRTFHRRMKSQIQKALSGSEVRTIDVRISLGISVSIWYHVRIEPLPDDDTDICMLYLTDNHQDMRLQSEISLLNEKLVRASRLSLLGQMSTEFAHQLIQPIQTILGRSELVLDRMANGTATPDSTRAGVQEIETSVNHARSLINSIRDFAKYRSLRVEQVPLAEILEDAIMMVSEQVSRLNGEFVLHEIPADCDVMADRTQTIHVFINLFVNALEATSDFGVDLPLISIFLDHPDDANGIAVVVKDNGPGLPTGRPEHIFEKFHTSKEDGLGLGLAISRDVCESQQGSLTASDNPGEPGCSFHVRFRLPDASP